MNIARVSVHRPVLTVMAALVVIIIGGTVGNRHDDPDLVAVGPAEDILGDRILHVVLDCPTKRAGAEVRIVALVDQELLGLVAEHQFQVVLV